jgi:predicted AlkP superfamily phosphohydrolase/phosphomutase
MASGPSGPPLIVVALDAGDLGFIQQWSNDGTLPAVSRILQQGSWGSVMDPDLFPEFGQWLTVFSGLHSAQHEFYYFRQLRPGTYDLQPYSYRDTGIPPFWTYLRGTGRKVAIIDAPECNLVRGLDGVQLSQWSARHLPQHPLSPQADPPQSLREARRVFGKRIPVEDYDAHSTPREDQRILHLMLERIERKGRLCRHLAAMDRYALMVIGFYEAHDASHRFWEYRPESGIKSAGHIPELANAVRLIYQAIDRELGLLLASLREDPNIVILSCYGMVTGFPTMGLPDGFCRELGYQVPAPVGKSLNLMSLARRLFPQQWRTAISDRLPVPVQERLMAAAFRGSTDWSRTRVFAIPCVNTGFLRVNLRTREPAGPIVPGKEYETLLDDLTADLRRLVDPVTGAPAVRSIGRISEITGGPPRQLPDLLVRWNSHHRFLDRVSHPQVDIKRERAWFHRTSDHSTEGFFAAAGPQIAPRGQLEPLSTLAVAPTLLRMLRVPIPADLKGQPRHLD